MLAIQLQKLYPDIIVKHTMVCTIWLLVRKRYPSRTEIPCNIQMIHKVLLTDMFRNHKDYSLTFFLITCVYTCMNVITWMVKNGTLLLLTCHALIISLKQSETNWERQKTSSGASPTTGLLKRIGPGSMKHLKEWVQILEPRPTYVDSVQQPIWRLELALLLLIPQGHHM